MRVLFVCHFNRKRSATAERIFGKDAALDIRSAGTSPDALVRVNGRMLEWADIVFTMDEAQQRDLSRMFPGHPGLDKIVCLGILDRYEFLDDELVRLLRERTAPHLRRTGSAES
jgi:protein-tyrosine phosphatase